MSIFRCCKGKEGVKIVNIYSKKICEICLTNKKQWIVILYEISQNYFLGVPIYSERKSQNDLFLNSIQKYINIEETKDFKRSYIKKYVYIKGNVLEITDKEFKMVLEEVKKHFLTFVAKNTVLDKEGIFYNKWCKDKLEILNKNCNISNTLKNGSICWANLGYNIGNELRKLRPVILWRSSSDKRMWTVIPLTSKHKKDCYYFHYDLCDKKLGTAKIESMMNISIKRIKEMYFLKNKIAKISKKDNDTILKIIKRYYAFELSNEGQNQLHKNSEKVVNKNSEKVVNKNSEKVLT